MVEVEEVFSLGDLLKQDWQGRRFFKIAKADNSPIDGGV